MLVDPITDKEFVLEHSHLIHELVPGGSKLINRLIANGFTLKDSYWEQIEDTSLVEEGKSLPDVFTVGYALVMAPPSLSLFPGCHESVALPSLLCMKQFPGRDSHHERMSEFMY